MKRKNEDTPHTKRILVDRFPIPAPRVAFTWLRVLYSHPSGGDATATEHSTQPNHRALLCSPRYRALTMGSMMILMEAMIPNGSGRTIEVELRRAIQMKSGVEDIVTCVVVLTCESTATD